MKTKTERRLAIWIPMMIGFALAVLLASPQTGSAQWSTSGNNIYYNSGNVGIGTNGPSGLLDIQGTSTGDTLLRVWNPSSSGTGTTTLRLANSSAQARGSRLQFTDSLYYVGMITGDRTNGLSFRTGTNAGAESSLYDRMTILPGGNIGVGTTNPGAPLHVNGVEVRLQTNNSFFSFYNSAGTRLGYIQDVYNADLRIMQEANQPLTLWTNATERLRVDSSGNVSIGTTSPGYKLDVQGGSINASGGLCIAGDCKSAWSQVGGGGAVASVFGRTGAVIAATNDYTWAQINKSTSSLADINIRSASDLSSGTLPDARFPATLPSVSGANLTALNANSLASGTVATARLGSGTANATTFLRGDNTWAVPSGGSQWTNGSNSIYYNSGNVGIGTSTPNKSSASKAITVNGSTDAIYELAIGDTRKGTMYHDGTVLSITNNANGALTLGTNNGEKLRVDSSGNVGIGTTNPTTKLHVQGDGKFTGNLTVDGNIAAKYQDVAEWVPSSEQLPTATVVVLDATKSNQVVRSTQAYDTRVAGVISEQPGIALGESGENKVLVATTGRVLVKVDATNGPIQIGDLLVTSDIPGVAMKSEPITIGNRKMHTPGTLIGKALEPLEKGSGKILVLLSLQ